ncbi:MAG: exodeoxyribonuclease VII large subunit [Candidatus Cyclobacteriaceae bacterium M3_2C_046]
MEHFSLLELNQLIKSTLDSSLEPSYWVVAEIGEMRINQKGHCYMELVEKEDDTLLAKIRANIWSYAFRNISGWFEKITGQSFKPGLKILANVVVQFHEIYGLCLIVRDVDPNYTLGERAQKKQKIIDQLIADGIFEMNKELSLPLVPQRVAVISSPTAAGWEDFLKQLENNRYGYRYEVSLYKAMMQGNQAEESIIMALHEIHQKLEQFDAVAILRGGGAQVDLDCFDTYDLASHVAQFPLPVLTGIGHERDETIVDLVAHTKLKTPTAVSEFLISGCKAYEDNLDFIYKKLVDQSRKRLQAENFRLREYGQQLKYWTIQTLRDHQNNLTGFKDKIQHLSLNKLRQHQENLKFVERSISMLNPRNVLKRGYTITTRNNQLLKHIDDLKPGDEVETMTFNQRITSQIRKIEDNDK